MSKRLILILSIIAVIVVTAILLNFSSFDTFLQAKIKDKLNSYINASEDGLYHYQYESMDIDVIGRVVRLKGISIQPKQAALDSIEQGKIKALIALEIGEVMLNNLFLYPLLVNNKIEVKRIMVSDTHFDYIFDKKVEPKPSNFMISNLFSDKLNGAFMHQIDILNTSISMKESYQMDTAYMSIDSMNIRLTNILVDKNTVKNMQPIDYGRFDISTGKIHGNFIDNYKLSASSLLISSLDSAIKITDFRLAPTTILNSESEKQFARAVFDIGVEELSLASININSWDEMGALEIKKISVNNPKVKISIDNKWPRPMHDKPILSASIRSIPIPLSIDTIDISNGDVVFHQITNNEKPSLTLKFGAINSTCSNVTNDSLILTKNPALTFNANTMFLDSARLDLRIIFNMLAPDDAYHVKISMGTMPFSVMNPILDDQANVQIYGELNAMDVEFDANKHNAKGTMAMDYSDLKLKLQKKKVTDDGTKEKSAWLLNTLVNPILRTNNNRDDENFKIGIVDYERPLDISFFGMLWHSTKTGLMSSLIPTQGQKKGKGENDKDAEEKKSNKKNKGNQPE